jgi:hypothetical protein
MKDYRKLLNELDEKIKSHKIEGGLQVIDQIGDPNADEIEVRYQQGDDQVLLTAKGEDQMAVRIWFQKDDVKDLRDSLDRVLRVLK